MLYPLFGLKVQSHEWLSHIATKYQGLKGVAAQLVLQEEYEESYGIVTTAELDNPLRPLAKIEMQPKEGLLWLYPKANRIRQYKLYKVKDNFGLSLKEFLSCTRDEVLMMLDDLERDIARKAANLPPPPPET